MSKRMFPLSVMVFALLFVPSSPPARSGESSDLIIEHGRRDVRDIALTFDACPTDLPDDYDEQVIDVLLRKNVPATLFLSGQWVEKNGLRTKFLADQPLFQLAAHTYSHPHLRDKPDERVLRELRRTQAIIKKSSGKTPRYFRPPFGEVDARVARLAREAGLTTIQYDIASGDPDPGLSPKRIVSAILRDAKGGSIIVLHMNRKGVHTAEILPELIDGLRKRDFTFVTVEELLRR